jgi:isochorismate synthase
LRKESKISVLDFDFDHFTKSEVLKAAIQSAFELSMPLAIWRLPNTSEIQFITSKKRAQKLDKVDFSELEKGFVFAQFDSKEGSKLFIEGDYQLSFDYQEIIESKKNIDSVKNFESNLQQNLSKQIDRPDFYTQDYRNQGSVNYKELVKKSVEAIKAGQFEKVVPARTKDVTLSEKFDVIDLFLRLTKDYQNAFISFVSIPEVGSWMGATPEILIEKKETLFRTVSLAGTKRFNENLAIAETAWNQKEIEEQAMVSRYIINCFKRIRLRDFKEKGPKTTKAGNLLHLKTSFEVDMEATRFPELPTVMLDLLHPTSAVAGMPKGPAIHFIQQNEQLNRSFYSGYLGPVNVNNATHVFVNLRCMELFKGYVRLYAGAGVTEDSDPEKEYLETEMKCNTLLNKIIHRV